MLKEPAVRATYIEPSQLVKYYHTRGIGKPEFNGVLQPPQYDIWNIWLFHMEIKGKKLAYNLFTCVIAANITSFYRTFGCPIICTDSIHSAILVIDTSNNASYNQVYWLIGTPYLSIKASSDYKL